MIQPEQSPKPQFDLLTVKLPLKQGGLFQMTSCEYLKSPHK